MNTTMIIGNLTRDPEVREVNGKSVCNFSVAINGRKNADGTQDVTYFNVAAWNQLGANCAKYLSKGRKVFVEGTVSVRAYADKNGNANASLQLLADKVEFLSAATSDAGNSNGNSRFTAATKVPAYGKAKQPVEVDEAEAELPW